MASRVCRDCRAIYNPSTTGARSGRCPNCARLADRARGTTTQRGYGAEHQRRRAAIQRRIDTGETVTCWRCGAQITGRAWDLGHDDRDRSITRGAECVTCNRATSGRLTTLGGAPGPLGS